MHNTPNMLEGIKFDFLQRTQSVFSMRPPTTTQKDSMARDFNMLEMLRHYTGLVVSDRIQRIAVPFDMLPNLEAHISHSPIAEAMPTTNFFMMESIFERAINWPNSLLLDSKEHFEKLIEMFRPNIRGVPIHVDARLAPSEMKFNDETINLHGAELEGRFKDPESNPINTAIVFFYLADTLVLLGETRNQGEKIKRVIPVFASKEANKLIMQRYMMHLKVMRGLLLDGFELKNITRDMMKEYIANLKAKQDEHESTSD